MSYNNIYLAMIRVFCLMMLMSLSIGAFAQKNNEITTTTTTTTVTTVTSGGKTTTTTKVTTTEVTKNERGDVVKTKTSVSESSSEKWDDTVEEKREGNVYNVTTDGAEGESGDLTKVEGAWGEASAVVNTAKDMTGLSMEEKKVYVYVNLARLDGHRFVEEYVIPYYEGKKVDKGYYESLISDLEVVKNRSMLRPHKKLIEAARYHAEDMGKKGMIGHVSSDGTTMSARLERYFPNYSRIAENCSYCYAGALDIVMQLLLDRNVPSLGHRKNILQDGMEYMGVAIAGHSEYSFICVQDFGKEMK